MKKIATLITALIIIFMFTPAANADWLITIAWTPSDSATVVEEKVYIDGVEVSVIPTGDAPTYSLVKTITANEEVTIIAYDGNGQPSDALIVGNLNAPTKPNSPTGGSIFYQWQ
jgi:hypothetical protein